MIKRTARAASDVQERIRALPRGIKLIVIYKLVWGLMEILSGVLIFFSYNYVVRELVEDPQDVFAQWVISHVSWTPLTTFYVALIMILFGLLKLLLVVGILSRSETVRRFLLAFFVAATAVATYELIHHFTYFRFVTLVFEVGILVYYWSVHVYPVSKLRKRMVV